MILPPPAAPMPPFAAGMAYTALCAITLGAAGSRSELAPGALLPALPAEETARLLRLGAIAPAAPLVPSAPAAPQSQSETGARKRSKTR